MLGKELPTMIRGYNPQGSRSAGSISCFHQTEFKPHKPSHPGEYSEELCLSSGTQLVQE